jgi:hypothetical protein
MSQYVAVSENTPEALAGSLTQPQQRFLAVIMEARSVTEAAEQCGISRRTAGRWLKEPEVQQALRELRQDALAHSTARLTAAYGEAIAFLCGLIGSERVPLALQVQAAKAILHASARALEDDALSDRLQSLESSLGALDPG